MTWRILGRSIGGREHVVEIDTGAYRITVSAIIRNDEEEARFNEDLAAITRNGGQE